MRRTVKVHREVVCNFLLEDEIDDIETGMLVELDVSNDIFETESIV